MLERIFKAKDDFDKNTLLKVSVDDYKPKITFFTGSGISQESGLETFRAADGLWSNHLVEEVATAHALQTNFKKVNNFFNDRRKEVLAAQPNRSHDILKELEKYFEVIVVTQNVDDLHERAGSSRIYHLHGEIMRSRPVGNAKVFYDQKKDIKVGDKCMLTRAQIRPHIVLFDEMLDDAILSDARKHIRESDVFVVVGSSLQVEPASSLVVEGFGLRDFIVVDPSTVFMKYNANYVHVKEKASVGLEMMLPQLIIKADQLKTQFKENKERLKV
jgi:NAD-dependent deacetylase